MCDDAVREVAFDPNYDPKRKGEGPGGDYAAYFSVRLRVFCDEQEISIDDEVDGADEKCKHYALFKGSQAVAVCRLSIEPPYAKIERVACLKEARGQGYARTLMLAVLRIVDAEYPNEIVAAHSQSAVLKFYERIGFIAVSREFLDEVDILHRSIVFPPRREKIRTLSLLSSPPSKHNEFAGDLYDGQVVTTIRRMLNEIENLSFIPLCSLVVSSISSLFIPSSLHEALCTVALRAQRANGYAENYTPFSPRLSTIEGVSDEEYLKAVAAKKMNTGEKITVEMLPLTALPGTGNGQDGLGCEGVTPFARGRSDNGTRCGRDTRRDDEEINDRAVLQRCPSFRR
ncbi:hypothetical protein PRIPAC_97036 [Pristionchus pacificus]|uniref:glucosamine-phosphate N-acetyltransferase n=1 Tax=Pristionchus pacificus TaxID=54126 RepID=A0A2A6D1H9_PRIPA|nr:hypothetical protein PRIPAC_97036 [Pristionchus pacificus]|eukprot:PDM84304.1 jmjd-5 [Pristionchus pacificus]